ncbi:MAG: DUF488 domain-containing protein [Candidatus Thiodiazotropha sp. (ex Monitilora ramsayi)]|nr:DUF488 domain-containing protein [Candidatus Thiodiazotropha sp. (ex Monitilora ramsayi)]
MHSELITIRVKRVYDPPDRLDGRRILVDRLWPRGLSKEKAEVDVWLKEISPSTELRRWYGHDPKKWDEFKRRYYKELTLNPDGIERFKNEVISGVVTLLYGSKEERLNNAVALKEFMDSMMKGRS